MWAKMRKTVADHGPLFSSVSALIAILVSAGGILFSQGTRDRLVTLLGGATQAELSAFRSAMIAERPDYLFNLFSGMTKEDCLAALKGAADNTLAAYGRDVGQFLDFLSRHHGGQEGMSALTDLGKFDLRAFMSEMHKRDVAPRSVARKLSAVKSFLAFVSDQEGNDATAALSVRVPKYKRKLPRPLAEDAARDMIAVVGDQAREEWVAARDMAIVTLLYGSGLRISEALGLTG